MNRFWTSDSHFGHKNVLRHDNRPFKTIEEHDEALITYWNETVKPNDEVRHLGDFCFRNDKPVEWYIKQLHGKIHLIRGNHDDKEAWKHKHLFASYAEAEYLRLDDERMYMLHYACRTWRNSHHGAWQLFGHSHGSMKACSQCHGGEGKVLDVWVGGHNYKPWNFDEIKEHMKDRPVTAHHESEE